MGYTTSTVHGIEVPDSAEANNIPEDIGKVVTALEGGSLGKRLTSAQIAALASPQKPSGLVVFNTTTGKLQISDGTNFSNVDKAVYAIGVRSSSVTLTHNTTSTMTYGSEDDPSSILSAGTVTVPTAGLWLITGAATVSSIALGDQMRIYLEHNAAVQVTSSAVGTNSAGPHNLIASTLVNAAASDTIRMRIWVTNPSSMDLSCTAARFTVHRVGT